MTLMDEKRGSGFSLNQTVTTAGGVFWAEPAAGSERTRLACAGYVCHRLGMYAGKQQGERGQQAQESQT